MKDIAAIATNLVQNEAGLWVARDQRAVSYPAEGNETYYAVEDRSFWFAHRNRVLAAVLRGFPPGGAMFDVGGGNGFVAAGLREAGFEVVVVEPGPAGAANALERGIPLVVRSTLEDAGFREASIPAIGLFDVLEHIERDAPFLEALHRHLVPGGRLYLTVPAHRALWSVEDDAAGHYRRYSAPSLRRALRTAGFTVEHCTYFFSCLAPAVFLLRSVPSRLRLRRSVTEKTTQSEHTLPGGAGGRLLSWCLDRETARIERGRGMPFGSSCLAVARREKERGGGD